MKNLIKPVVIICAVFALMYISLFPELQYFRDSFYYDLLIFLIVDAIVLYVMFAKKLKTSKPSKIVLSLILFYPLLRYTDLTPRIKDLILYLHGLLIVLITVIVFINNHRHNNSSSVIEKYPMISGIFLMIISALITIDINYIDKQSIFWIISGIIASLFTLLSILIVIRNKDNISDKQNLYAIPLLVMMIGFIFPALSLMFLNYALDTSEPIIYQAEVIEKEINQGGRSVTTYNLTIVYEGKAIELGTSQSDYYQLNIGDFIEISKYVGAFKVSYLIYEP